MNTENNYKLALGDIIKFGRISYKISDLYLPLADKKKKSVNFGGGEPSPENVISKDEQQKINWGHINTYENGDRRTRMSDMLHRTIAGGISPNMEHPEDVHEHVLAHVIPTLNHERSPEARVTEKLIKYKDLIENKRI